MNQSNLDTRPAETGPRFIRLPEVCQLLGASKATVYRWEREDPTFPKRVKLTERLSAWRADHLATWIEARTAESNKPT